MWLYHFLNIYCKQKCDVSCGGQLIPELLFRLRGLGLWPNNPVRGRENIRGLSDKEEMKWYYRKRQSIFVVDLIVSEEDVHLRTSVRGG